MPKQLPIHATIDGYAELDTTDIDALEQRVGALEASLDDLEARLDALESEPDEPDEPDPPEPEPDEFWLNPQPGDVLTGTETLQINAPEGTTRVLFYVDGGWVGNALAPPWQIEHDFGPYPDGPVDLRANARDDDAGVVLHNETITVEIDNATVGDPDQEQPVAGQACPLWVHASYGGAWHPPHDPESGCWIGHEHGDEPDPDGHFAAAGVEPVNLSHLTDLYEVHLEKRGMSLDALPWATEQYKVQYLDTGDPAMLGRHQFVNINDNALAAWGEPHYISDRNDAYEWASYIPVRVNLLGPNGTFIDMRWVCKIADVHNKGSAVSEFDKEWFVQLHQNDPDAARDFLSNGRRGIAFYITSFSSDRKRGHHFVQVGGKDLFRYDFFYRMMDSSVYSSGTMENNYSASDPYAEGNWHLGSLRWTSRASMGSFASPGIYWTDIYGQQILGTGETPPDTDEYAVKQVIGFTSGVRSYVHESNPSNALVSPSLARLYDAPGLRFPN